MAISLTSLPESTVRSLLGVIAPDSRLESTCPVAGDTYNRVFYIDAQAMDGRPLHFVLKLYQGELSYCTHQARTEFKTLEWLFRCRRPVPEPVFLDESGSLLGGPAIVTRFLPGQPVMAPPYPEDWGRQMALALASIHAYPCNPVEQNFLLDANHGALWFRRSGTIPAWLAADPDGEAIWQAIDAWLPRMEAVVPKLIHSDFWAGNLLCHEGQIIAIIDWGEAGFGDPGVDVAYGLMDLRLTGLDNEAESFLAAYEAETGGPVANLGLWQLAAAARPIYLPQGWIDHSPVRERFRRFVQEALQT
jgi:aminoglycoside phosphotransferase (APT) family kinase protein